MTDITDEEIAAKKVTLIKDYIAELEAAGRGGYLDAARERRRPIVAEFCRVFFDERAKEPS